MNSRERVLRSIEFKDIDRLAKDLGGMASTGISAFAYPKLVEKLGLPYRKPKVHDIGQMLALPDMDVLDALGCDVVCFFNGVTNAFDQPQEWQDYDFNGRLNAQVRDNSIFETDTDGTIRIPSLKSKMPPTSTVFDTEHGGHSICLSGEVPKPNLDKLRLELQDKFPSDEQMRQTAILCEKVRQSTDKAIFFNGPIYSGLGICSFGGMGIFPILCILEPEYVKEIHQIITDNAIKIIRKMLPAIKDNIDVIMFAADDWGTQNSLIAPPQVYENLFMPFLKRMNSEIKENAPDVKTFLHSCGNIIEIIPMIVEAGFDILNPVQWSTTGEGSFKTWKQMTDNKIALWGGGIDSQHTLPLGTVEQVVDQVKQTVNCFSKGSGYIFTNTHNILSEIEPEKIMAMYKTADLAI